MWGERGSQRKGPCEPGVRGGITRLETGYGAWAVEHVLQALGIPVEEGKLEQDRGEEGLEPCRWPGVQDELEGPRGLRAEPSHTVGGRGGP